jgi:hypothetical protein
MIAGLEAEGYRFVLPRDYIEVKRDRDETRLEGKLSGSCSE